MVTAQNILYSRSSLARILGISANLIVRLEVWHSVVFAVVRGRRPMFYSKRIFQNHFFAWRKAQSRALTATQNLFNPSVFCVRNELKGTTYQVQFYVGGANCQCDDFTNQSQFFGNASCKHIFSALNKLNYESLSDYITASSLPRAS